MNTTKKRGRKPKPYTAADGTKINGLRFREHDKRWILADGRTFTEPDEARALAKFRRLTRTKTPGDAILLNRADPAEFGDAFAKVYGDGDGDPWALIDEASYWARVAKDIRERPQYVAKMTGDERLGYLDKIDPPAKLPSLTELATLWWDKAEVTSNERQKVRDAWADFVGTTGVDGIKSIKADVALAFKDAVAKRDWSVKTMRHRFNRVRRVLSFAVERGVAVEECTRALTHLRFKLKRTKTITMPSPIDPATFKTLLGEAKGDDKALLLCLLNFGMYVAEAVRLRWDEIADGCYVGQRAKTGQSLRVAVLWPETVEALAAVARKGDYVFISNEGSRLTASGAGKRFRKLREAAKVPHVTGSQFRDGAYQAMVKANVTADLCKLLVGHSCGLKDNYVLRDPSMVAPACDAIRAAYIL